MATTKSIICDQQTGAEEENKSRREKQNEVSVRDNFLYSKRQLVQYRLNKGRA